MKFENQKDFITLLKKYNFLLKENQALKVENKKLKIQLGLIEPEKEKIEITTHITNQITSVNK